MIYGWVDEGTTRAGRLLTSGMCWKTTFPKVTNRCDAILRLAGQARTQQIRNPWHTFLPTVTSDLIKGILVDSTWVIQGAKLPSQRLCGRFALKTHHVARRPSLITGHHPLSITRKISESPPRNRSIKVRDINLRYADWGDNGPVLLLLHGSMRTSRSWDAVARDLCGRFHVISLDARGHGASDWTERGYRFSNRVEDVRAFCDQLALEDVIAVGHSSGAVVLTMLADKHPATVNKLVLLEGMVVVEETPMKSAVQHPKRPRRTWGSREELHAYLRQHRTAGRWRDDVIVDVVNHETMELPDGRIDMKWSSNSLNSEEGRGDYYDLRPIFRTSNLPILFIVGEQRAETFRDLQALSADIPSFHLTTVQRTGHNMYMERPDAVASLITAFADDKAVPDLV